MFNLLRTVLPLCLSLPIAIFAIGDVEIPLSDVVLVFGLVFFLLNSNTKAARYLYVVFILALLSVVIKQISEDVSMGLKPYFSVIFFLKPLLGYFAARGIIKNLADSNAVLRVMSFWMAVSLLLIFLDVIINYSGVPRADSVMNGSILGLPQYASYGVNSAACFYFVMFVVVLYSCAINLEKRLLNVFKMTALVAGTYLILGSLSREVILAFLLFAGLFFVSQRGHVKYLFVFVSIISATVAFYFLPDDLFNSSFLDAKIRQVVDGFSSGDFNHVSSGRFDLYEVALNQWLRSPIFGNGFHGYLLYPDLIIFDMEPEGLSPHNQYLTVLWKGGGAFFVAYFAYVFFLVRKSGIFSGERQPEYLLGLFYVCTFILLANLWDVLMVANFGAVFFFLLGVFESRVKAGEVSDA